MFAWKPDPVSRTETSQKMPVSLTCVTGRLISQLRKVEEHCLSSTFLLDHLRAGENTCGGIVTLDSQTHLSGCIALDNDTACIVLSAITCKGNQSPETSGNYWGSGSGPSVRISFETPSPHKRAWTDWEKKIPNKTSFGNLFGNCSE